MKKEITLEQAERLVKETGYAIEAAEQEENPINWADAAAFFLEGWNAAVEPEKSRKCRADTLHDEIVEVLTRAVDEGASLVEISGALHVAVVQVQGQVYESFRLQRCKEIGGKPGKGDES